MKRGHRSERAARIVGAALGLATVAAVVVASLIPGGTGKLGADVTFISNPTGELAVSPPGPVLELNGLQPAAGPSQQGAFTVTNIASRTQAIGLRALPSTVDLDELLRVRVTAGGDDLFDGSLSGLVGGSPLSLRLRPGRSAELIVAAWLPPSVSSGYQGRIDDVALQFVTSGSGE